MFLVGTLASNPRVALSNPRVAQHTGHGVRMDGTCVLVRREVLCVLCVDNSP